MLLAAAVVVLLTGILGISLAVLAGLIAWRRCGVVAGLLVGMLLLSSPLLAWKWYLHRHALGHLPEALEVDTVEFRAEDRWGLIGFGNVDDIGLLLYELPAEQARRIAQEGASYLERLPYRPRMNGRDWRGRFNGWRETPLPHGIPFTRNSRLCDFEDCPAVPFAIRARVEKVASQPGSYYAHGRIGTIIVSPAEKLVVFHYSGL